MDSESSRAQKSPESARQMADQQVDRSGSPFGG